MVRVHSFQPRELRGRVLTTVDVPDFSGSDDKDMWHFLHAQRSYMIPFPQKYSSKIQENNMYTVIEYAVCLSSKLDRRMLLDAHTSAT